MKKIISPIPLVLAAIVVVIITIGLLIPGNKGTPKFYRDSRKCAATLKQIGNACALYNEKNNNKWPTKLTDLIPTYLADPKGLNCPITNKPYTYIQPRSDAPENEVVINCIQHKPIEVRLDKGGCVLTEYVK